MQKYRKYILIAALVMVVLHLLNVDYDKITDLKVNLSPYLGIVSMSLIALAMYLSDKNSEEK